MIQETTENAPTLTSRIHPSVNPKQVFAFGLVFMMVAFFEACKRAVLEGKPRPKPTRPEHTRREFYYGGAIRGGKTYLYLTIICLLCKKYPGMRAHVIRRSMTELEGITKSSLERIIGRAPVKWKRSAKEYFVQFRNGSRIYLFSENHNADPNGNRFLGLETNVILLEQMEELQHKTLQLARQRIGSWRLNDEPPALILGTFNPTFNWVKEVIHDTWEKTPDEADFIFTTALPDDNLTNTDEQWASWKKLDDITYRRMIGGEWNVDLKGRFFHAFKQGHISDSIAYNPDFPLWYSFDFNVDPSCAIAFQTDEETFFHVLYEVRIEDGDTPNVCDALQDARPEGVYEKVTGDSSGLARMSGLRGHLSQYQVIRNELDISEDQFVLPSSNPEIPDSRAFVNSCISRFPGFKVHRRCKYLIHDLNFVKIRRDVAGRINIQKTGKLENAPLNAESMGHLGDCLRYGLHVTLYNFVTIPTS